MKKKTVMIVVAIIMVIVSTFIILNNKPNNEMNNLVSENTDNAIAEESIQQSELPVTEVENTWEWQREKHYMSLEKKIYLINLI